MSAELTNRTRVVVSRLGDFWVTSDQADVVAMALETQAACVELEGNIVRCSSIDGVVTAEQYAVLNRKRQGAWQCRYAQWHDRGSTCAHGELERLRQRR